MRIRLMNARDDRLAISRVYEASWKSAYRGIMPQAYLDGIPEDRWAGKLDDPGWHTLVMLEDERIIGTSTYCASRFKDMPDYGEIVSIYLLPEYFGRGYGRPLLKAGMDGLRHLGYADIFLWVLEDNARARRFYERCGFAADGGWLTVDLGGKELREVRYTRHLEP